ncbi:MAG: 4Fe-4S binding protein [Spirochaetales bacterium]|nr:4Fe-4S binding protein [Spirochaetales bacterium]
MAAKKNPLFKIIRFSILGLMLIGSMVIHYLHIYGGAIYPSVHSICPFGGLENLWSFVAGHSNISKIFSGTMVLFFLTALIAVFFRRSFCGNICPFGAIQEFLGKIFPKKIKVPPAIDKVLKYLKYVLLLLSIIMAWATMSLWISPYDPWAAFGHLFTGSEVFTEFLIGTIILIVITLASFVINRPFCRYLCPAGAFYALVGKISPSYVERNPQTCINCKLCTKNCPVDLEVHKMEKVKSGECISCGICVDVCPQPEPGTMIASKFGSKKIKPLVFLLVSVGIFFGALFILDAAGLYKVSIPPVEEILEKQDFISVGDLRGSMTIEQGAFYSGKSLDQFYEIMEIPKEVPKDTLMKYLSSYIKGYDFHVMKAKKALE